MGNKQIVKQMIDLQKKSFYNCFSTMVMLQDQAEKLLKNFIDHIPGMSDEVKKVMEQWNSAYKKSRDDFMKAVDDGYAKVESFLYYYNAMVMFQDQTKGIFKNWIPQDFKKTMDEMTAMHKKNRDEFKKYIDENIRHLQDFFPVANKPQTKTK